MLRRQSASVCPWGSKAHIRSISPFTRRAACTAEHNDMQNTPDQLPWRALMKPEYDAGKYELNTTRRHKGK